MGWETLNIDYLACITLCFRLICILELEDKILNFNFTLKIVSFANVYFQNIPSQELFMSSLRNGSNKVICTLFDPYSGSCLKWAILGQKGRSIRPKVDQRLVGLGLKLK